MNFKISTSEFKRLDFEENKFDTVVDVFGF